jgi:hypothetical protein
MMVASKSLEDGVLLASAPGHGSQRARRIRAQERGLDASSGISHVATCSLNDHSVHSACVLARQMTANDSQGTWHLGFAAVLCCPQSHEY